MVKFSSTTAIAIVIANMIGTGVFTSLGFQLMDVQSGSAILLLWVIGGIAALCGALTYAELGSQLPRSGGEYNFLGRLYHPAMGFVSGWISITIGFAAPIALAAMTFAAYLGSAFEGLSREMLAVGLILSLTVLHGVTRSLSGGTQVVFTALKVALVVGFSAAALTVGETRSIDFSFGETEIAYLGSGAFAVSLIYVNYAYTGWNAATYLIDEVDEPARNLPKILIVGTGLVMLSYVLLNYVFLSVAPIEAMQGKIEIGMIAADYAFGEAGGRAMGITLSLLLISTVSAMLMAGPRVLQVIGQDFHLFRWLAKTNRDGIPMTAIWAVALLSVALVLSSSFESVLVFSGFILALNTFFAVGGIFVLRARQKREGTPLDGYRTWGYPLTPLLYLALTGWTLVFIFIERPVEALAAVVMIAAGLGLYWFSERKGAVS